MHFLQIPNPLADPVMALLIQIVITAAGVVVSFFVATYRGEMAATRFTLDETKRMDHARILVNSTFVNIRGTLPYVNEMLKVREKDEGGLSIITAKIVRGDISYETKLMLEHLSTGYPHVEKAMTNYRVTYNLLADRTFEIYDKALQMLKDVCSPERIGFEASISYEGILRAFSEEITNQFVFKRKPNLVKHTQDGYVRLGQYDILQISKDRGEILVRAINSLFDSHAIVGSLLLVWMDAQPLHAERKKIEDELNRIKAWVDAGIHLEGSCEAGIKAKYEVANHYYFPI